MDTADEETGYLVNLTDSDKPQDGLISHVRVQLSVADRLRLLMRGWIDVTVNTETQHVIGWCRSASHVTVPRFFDRKRDAGWAEAR